METIWIDEKKLPNILRRNESFWRGELEDGPLMWIMTPQARPVAPLADPASDEEMWTDADYVMKSTERDLAAMHYAGDALPIFQPWLGPDQFAAFLGAEIALKPREYTSWIKPCIEDWDTPPKFTLDPNNRWWKLYLELYRASVEAGKGKWVTCYPDLHSGIDALSAMRGPERLSMDLLLNPNPVKRAIKQMTPIWKQIVDTISDIILPAKQGTSNWSWGWSERRYLCIGQNDYTCMISPQMFDEFALEDTVETTNHVEVSLYHLDGPDALPHLPRLLQIDKLTCIQWIQGDGKPTPIHWLDLLRRIQRSGKLVQVVYNLHTTKNCCNILEEIKILCRELDPTKLFIVAYVDKPELADECVKVARL